MEQILAQCSVLFSTTVVLMAAIVWRNLHKRSRLGNLSRAFPTASQALSLAETSIDLHFVGALPELPSRRFAELPVRIRYALEVVQEYVADAIARPSLEDHVSSIKDLASSVATT